MCVWVQPPLTRANYKKGFLKFFAVDVVEFAKQGGVGRENNYDWRFCLNEFNNEHALSLALLKMCFASEHFWVSSLAQSGNIVVVTRWKPNWETQARPEVTESNSNDDAEKFVKWYLTPSHRISQIQMMVLRSLSNDTVLHLTGSVKFKWWCWEVCQMILNSISQDQSNSNDGAEKFVKWYRTPSHRISQIQMMMLRSLSNDTVLHLTGSVKFKWWCWEVCQMIPNSISQDQSNSNDDERSLSNDTVLHFTGSVKFKWWWEKFVKWYRTPFHRISQTQMMMREVCQMIPNSISQDQSNSNDDERSLSNDTVLIHINCMTSHDAMSSGSMWTFWRLVTQTLGQAGMC